MVSRISNPRGAHQRTRRSSSMVVLIVGFIGGFSLSKLLDRIVMNGDEARISYILAKQLPNTKDYRSSDRIVWDAHGWGTIHVFYGEASAIFGDDTSQQFFAQVKQDEIVLDLMHDINENSNLKSKDEHPFFFIDLAANDAKTLSNTLALEQRGWQGLCIEPNPAYWYGLAHRRNCTVIGALISDKVAPTQVKFRGVFGGIVGQMDEKLANRLREPDRIVETRYTVPFVALLEQFQVPKVIDYMSLDVEGAEFLVMHDFPFDEYTIQILTVERPSKRLKSLLESHGYVFLKDLAWWGETLWAHQSTGLSPLHPKIVKIKTEGRNR